MASAFAASKMLPMIDRAISGEKTTGACCVFACTRAQPAQRPARRLAADLVGVFELARGARARVPVVLLHVAGGVLRDRRGREAAVGAAVLAEEAARVGQDLVRGRGVEVAALGVLDARVVGHRGGLDAARDLDALGRRLLVHVLEVEAEIAFQLAELLALGQPGEGIFAGDARQRDRAGDQLAERVLGEVAREVLAVLLTDKDAQADGARAGLLQLFDLAEADQRGELIALVEDGFGVGGSGLQGAGDDVGGELLEIGRGVCRGSGHDQDLMKLGCTASILVRCRSRIASEVAIISCTHLTRSDVACSKCRSESRSQHSAAEEAIKATTVKMTFSDFAKPSVSAPRSSERGDWQRGHPEVTLFVQDELPYEMTRLLRISWSVRDGSRRSSAR